jgi:hypothetical protein
MERRRYIIICHPINGVSREKADPNQNSKDQTIPLNRRQLKTAKTLITWEH